MKIILILTTSFLVSYRFSQNPNSSFFTKSDAFFKEFVIGNRVNYDAISENPEKLDALFSEISSTNLSDISNETRKAYLINTYNILVIHQVLEYYPILSPMDISGFFDDKKLLYQLSKKFRPDVNYSMTATLDTPVEGGQNPYPALKQFILMQPLPKANPESVLYWFNNSALLEKGKNLCAYRTTDSRIIKSIGLFLR